MIFNEFQDNVIQWSTDRNIIKNGKPYTQALKLSEEWGEVCRALAKDDEKELKDGIGDSSVVAVNLSRMMGKELLVSPPPVEPFSVQVDEAHVVASIHWLIINIYQHFVTDYQLNSSRICIDAILNDLVFNFSMLAQLKGLDYMDCCAHAWNEIKDRKGYLNEQGVFIKEQP